MSERGDSVRGRERAEDRRVAFDRLTQRRLERAYRLATALLDDPSEAQDAVHDAAVQAWAGWGSLRDPARFDAWFDRIVVNRCRDRLRRRRGRSAVVAIAPDLAGPDRSGDAAEREALGVALGRLDADHRTVLVLRFVDDRTVAEIAALTGAREGTVKSRLHYGVRQLRAAYDAADRSGGGSR